MGELGIFLAAGAVLGAIAGSFVATILVRWPEGRSVSGRSRCDGCGEALRAWELVPVLSHLAARGHCRRRGAAIDPRHLGVELACAGMGAIAILAQPGLSGLAGALFGWWLLTIAALDVEHLWIPDRLTLPLIPAGFVVALIPVGLPLADRLVGAVAGFAVLALIRAVYRVIRRREGMGGGDPKLLAGIGAWLGWEQLPLVLIGAGLIGLAAILLKRMRGGSVTGADQLPLGTLMALAAWPIWLLSAPA